MKKLLIIMVLLAALGAGGWFAWQKYFLRLSPTETYERMMAGAALGDDALFLEGFTSDSAKLMKAFLALSRGYEEMSDQPYRQLVRAEVVAQNIDGDRATVVVELGRREVDIPFVLEDGHWKLDGFALEEQWR